MIRVLEAFAGIGGMALGWHRASVEHVAFIERDKYARRVLARHWPDAPQHDDILTFDAAPYRGCVDVLVGGPPCQPSSSAGLRRGTADSRWLWPAFVDLAVALDAPLAVAENPLGLLSVLGGDAFASVLHALGDYGYSVEWDVLAAGTLGAPHRRDRVFIVARRDGRETWTGGQPSMFQGRPGAWPKAGRWADGRLTERERRWPTPGVLPWETAADADALPTPQAHDANPPGAGHMARGGRHADLPSAVRRALPTPCAGGHNDGEDIDQWEARRQRLAERHGNNGAGTPLAVAAKRRALPTPTSTDAADRDYQIANGTAYPTLDHAAKSAAGVESQLIRKALPTPQAHDAKGAPGAAHMAAGGRQADLPSAIRRALPTPQAYSHGADSNAPGTTLLDRAVRGMTEGGNRPARRALPTPTARDGKDGTAEACAGVEVNALLDREVHQRATGGGSLAPELPEWMMGLPLGWSLPEGPPMLDAPSAPWLPDRTAELALTDKRKHRRDRLRCVGNAVCVQVAEAIAREVLSS